MFSLILGFIIGCVAAVFLGALSAPFVWKRALFLARKVVRSELPLSLKEIEADRDFLRARQAVDVCRLQDALEQERREDYARKLALSRGRERLSQYDKLQAECAAQRRVLEAQGKKLAALEEKNRALKEKAAASLKLKQADLAEFRRQLKQIAAQTAGFIAAREGAASPVLRLVKDEAPLRSAPARGGTKNKNAGGETLAAAIARAAEAAAAAESKPALAVKRTAKPKRPRAEKTHNFP